MLLALPLALAAGAQTFGPDPGASGPPMAGFAQLYVEPTATLPLLPPADPAVPSTVCSLVLTNPTTERVDLDVSGTRLGSFNPHQVVIIEGVPSGTYQVTLHLRSGFQREFLVPCGTAATARPEPAPPPPAP